ncbi:MAG: metallophosphoesterase [Myxococcales bacterium]|nr:metallophosphoesterase [Myxococcales bacterium]
MLHFSDPHIEEGFAGVPLRAFLNKRLVGWANLVLRRRRRYREAAQKLLALQAFARGESVDLVVCTGDLSSLGTMPELRRAHELLAPFAAAPLGLATIPGNHDLYVEDDGSFESLFGEFMGTDRPALAGQDGWPRVRLFGESLALITFLSARPNPQPWRSSGCVPAAQLDALRAMLEGGELEGRFLLLGTHYALTLPDGSPDTRHHGMVNAAALRRVLAPVSRGAYLHGHVHHCYQGRPQGLSIPSFGAGSVTDAGREGFWLFEIAADGAKARRGRWTGEGYALDAGALVF